jgi:hypothetical protein
MQIQIDPFGEEIKLVKTIVSNPTALLMSAVSRVTNMGSSGCALVIIDEDEKDDQIQAEIDFVKFCNKKIGLKIFLFYIKQADVFSGGAPIKKVKIVRFLGLNGKVINQSIKKAAGHSATILQKSDLSCFKDTKVQTDETRKNSVFHKLLQEKDVDCLIITGRFMASCIPATIDDAIALKYKVLTASTVIFGPRKESTEGWMDSENVEYYSTG